MYARIICGTWGEWICSYALLFFARKHIVHVGKCTVTATKAHRRAQAGWTSTTTRRRAHRTALFTAARNPAACIYFSAFRRMRLTHSTVVSKEYAKQCWEGKRRNDACSLKNTPKKANWKESIRRNKQIRGRFRSSKERRPRDASALSVLFGVDRGQVFVPWFTQ